MGSGSATLSAASTPGLSLGVTRSCDETMIVGLRIVLILPPSSRCRNVRAPSGVSCPGGAICRKLYERRPDWFQLSIRSFGGRSFKKWRIFTTFGCIVRLQSRSSEEVPCPSLRPALSGAFMRHAERRLTFL